MMNKNFALDRIRSFVDKQEEGRSFFEKLVMTTADITALIGCSERHIRSLVADDRIPHFYVGRLLRFHRDQVLEWLLKGGTK